MKGFVRGLLERFDEDETEQGEPDWRKTEPGRKYQSVQRKVRRLIGRGSTDSGRGTTTMFFERGEEAWSQAKANLDRAFGEPKEDKHAYHYSSESGRVTLKKHEEGTNNFVTIGYMPAYGYGEYQSEFTAERGGSKLDAVKEPMPD